MYQHSNKYNMIIFCINSEAYNKKISQGDVKILILSFNYNDIKMIVISKHVWG